MSTLSTGACSSWLIQTSTRAQDWISAITHALSWAIKMTLLDTKLLSLWFLLCPTPVTLKE